VGAEGAPAKEKAAEEADPEAEEAGVAGPEEEAAADPEAGEVDPEAAAAVDPEAAAVDPEAEEAGLVAAEAEGLRIRNLHFDTIFSPKATGVHLIGTLGKLFIE